MRIKDCYSPSDIEIFNFARKLKRVGLDNENFIVDMDDFYREHVGIKRRTGWDADPYLYDLVVSLLSGRERSKENRRGERA